MMWNSSVRYIEVTRCPFDTPMKRARIRTIFTKGHPGPYDTRGTNRPCHAYLHYSLILFIAGGLIYLFNTNRAVFYAVAWWVGLMTIAYALVSVLAFLDPDVMIHTPLSKPTLRIYLGISFVVFQVCSYIPPLHGVRDITKSNYDDLSRRYSGGIRRGKRREAEKIASKPSSEIDSLILKRILLTLDEDGALETFFDSIPGFCNSKLTVLPLTSWVQTKLRQALHGFLNRTFSSNMVSESVRVNRLIICLNAAHAALGPSAASRILDNAFNGHLNEALQSAEIGHALRLWGHGRDHDPKIRRIVARIIARARQRDERWTTLVKETFGVSDDILRDNLAHGDSVLLSILIHASRQANRARSLTSGILSSLSEFDIHNTLPGLRHDFCALWNEITEEARNQGLFRASVQTRILGEIRHLYVALQVTDAASTESTVSTISINDYDLVPFQSSSYSFCTITSHRPPSTTCISVNNSDTIPFPTQPGSSSAPPHQSTLSGSAALQLAKETNIIAGRPWRSDQTTASEIGESSQATTSTESVLSIHNAPVLTNAPPPGAVAVAMRDIPSTATLSRPLEGSDLQDIFPACAEQDISEISSAGPAPTPTSILIPLPVLASRGADPAFTSRPLLPSPSIISFASSGSRPPPQASHLQISNVVAPPSGTTPCPINNDTLPRLRARGLVNSENNCLANAVFQLLVHCPPFLNLFKDLGELVGQQGLGEDKETSGGATPLVDAMVKFLNGFVYKVELSMPQQSQQNATKGKVRGDEDGKKEHGVVGSFNPRYMCDAMKENRRLKHLLVCSRNQDTPICC